MVEKESKMEESFIKVKTLKVDTISSIFKSISNKPGLTADIGRKELTSFQFRLTGKNAYEVCLPKNLESYIDSWVVRLAVAAGLQLQAEFVSSQDDVKELKYIKDWEYYLHGVAAAIRSSVDLKDVLPDGTTGKFHQGYNWAVSHVLNSQVNRDMYRTSYTNLWEALSGNAVWNANAPEWQRNLYHLVVTACKTLNVKNKALFAKSPEQVINAKFTKEWSFENRAVFSDYEVSYMSNRIRHDLEPYKEWLKEIKYKWTEHVDTCMIEYGNFTKVLKPYDTRISAIGTIRANAIFRSTKRGKKDTIPYGLTREARLEYLSFAAWIQATNPTGLGSDDRIETKLPFNDDLVAAEQFLNTYVEIFNNEKNTDPKLLQPWIEQAMMRAKAIIKANT